VRKERLELSILSALASKTSVYTIPPLAHLFLKNSVSSVANLYNYYMI